jgi:hypothetical protein
MQIIGPMNKELFCNLLRGWAIHTNQLTGEVRKRFWRVMNSVRLPFEIRIRVSTMCPGSAQRLNDRQWKILVSK